jgi:hypothetical protein
MRNCALEGVITRPVTSGDWAELFAAGSDPEICIPLRDIRNSRAGLSTAAGNGPRPNPGIAAGFSAALIATVADQSDLAELRLCEKRCAGCLRAPRESFEN